MKAYIIAAVTAVVLGATTAAVMPADAATTKVVLKVGTGHPHRVHYCRTWGYHPHHVRYCRFWGWR